MSLSKTLIPDIDYYRVMDNWIQFWPDVFVTESEKKALRAHFIVFHKRGKKEKSHIFDKKFFSIKCVP